MEDLIGKQYVHGRERFACSSIFENFFNRLAKLFWLIFRNVVAKSNLLDSIFRKKLQLILRTSDEPIFFSYQILVQDFFFLSDVDRGPSFHMIWLRLYYQSPIMQILAFSSLKLLKILDNKDNGH